MSQGILLDSLYWSVAADTQKFVNSMYTASNTITRFQGLLTSGNLALAALGVTSAIVAGKAIAMAAALDLELRRIITITDMSEARLAELGQEMISMSKLIPQSAAELARALYETLQAGLLDTRDATMAMTAASKFAVAGLTDTATAVGALTSVLNAYQISASESWHVTDIFFQTIRLGNMSAHELALSVGNMTTTAALAGVKLEELFSGLSTLTLFGLNAEESSLAMNRFLLSIVQNNKRVQNAAKEMGVEFNATALRTKGLTQFLSDLHDKLGGNVVALQRIMPNVRAFRAGAVLIGMGFSEYRRVLADMATAQGSTQQAFERVSGAMKNQAQILRNNLNAQLLRLGQFLLPPIIKLLTAINQLMLSPEEKMIQSLERLGVQGPVLERLFKSFTLDKLRAQLRQGAADIDAFYNSAAGPHLPRSTIQEMDREIAARREHARGIAAALTTAEIAWQTRQEELRRTFVGRQRLELMGQISPTTPHGIGSDPTKVAVEDLRTRLNLTADQADNYQRMRDTIQRQLELVELINGVESGRIRSARDLQQEMDRINGIVTEMETANENAAKLQAARLQVLQMFQQQFFTPANMAVLNLQRMRAEITKTFEDAGASVPADVRNMIDRIDAELVKGIDTEVVQRQVADLEKLIEDQDSAAELGAISNAALATEWQRENAVMDQQIELRRKAIQQLRQMAALNGNNADIQTIVNNKIRDLNREIQRLVLGLKAVDAEEEKSEKKKKAEDMKKTLELVKDQVHGVLELGRAFGILSEQQASMLRNATDLFEYVPKLMEGGATALGAVVPALGAFAGVAAGLVSLFSSGGESEEDKRRREIQERNTEAILKLTYEIGNMNSNITGRQYGGIRAAGTQMQTAYAAERAYQEEYAAWQDRRAAYDRYLADMRNWQHQGNALGGMMPQNPGMPGPVPIRPTGIQGGIGIERFLNETGLSLQDFLAVADDLNIELQDRLHPTITDVNAVLEAMSKLELTRVIESWRGQFAMLQEQFEIFDITDPIEQLRMLIDLSRNSKWGNEWLSKRVSGFDINTTEGRAALDAFIRSAYAQIQAGTLPESSLGGMTFDEFRQYLQDLEKTLDAASQAAGDTVSSGRSVQITELQADRLLSYQSTQTILQQRMVNLLSAIAGISPTTAATYAPVAMNGSTLGSATIEIGGVIINMTVSATSPEQLASITGDAVVKAIDKSLAVLYNRQQRLQGVN